jgi:hypothetical protein
LNALELAYPGGGARRRGDVVLLSLTSGNSANIAPNGRTITVTDQTPLAASQTMSSGGGSDAVAGAVGAAEVVADAAGAVDAAGKPAVTPGAQFDAGQY